MTRSANHSLLALATFATLAGASACGEGTSAPVPQPVPFYIRTSTPTGKTEKVVVVGLNGAVGGAGTVKVRVLAGGIEASGPSSSKGSFSVVIASVAQELEAAFVTAEGESAWVSLQGRTLGAPPSLSAANALGEVVSAPDAKGQVTVTNDGGSATPLLQATASSDVLVSNATSGDVAATTTDKKGLFTVTIAGARGDEIRIFLASPSDSTSTSDYLSYPVP
jgi:hypothetical protein